MKNYTSTKIKDFNVGDKFEFYNSIFEVTGDLKIFIEESGVVVYGRNCKIVKPIEKESNISGLLNGYNWMQGTEEVTYAKI